MSVPSSILKNKYEGNGVQTAFDYDFKIFTKSQVLVKKIVGTVETTLTVDVDYTITGVGDDNGGTVNYPISGTKLAAGQYIVIKPNFEFTQEVVLSNQQAFPPKTVEYAMDTLCMQIKQVADSMNRSVLLTDAYENTPSELLDIILAVEPQYESALASAAAAASSAAGAAASQSAAATSASEAAAYSVGWLKQTVTVNPATGQTQSYFNDMVSLKVADTGGTLVERIRVLRDGRVGLCVPNDHYAGTFPGIGIDLDIHRDYDADGVTARGPSMRLDHSLGGVPTYRTDAWPVISGSTLGQLVAAFDGNEVGRIGWTAPSDSIPVGTDHTNKYDGRRSTAGNFDHGNYIIQTRYDRSSSLFTAFLLDRYGNVCIGNNTPSHALHVYRADGNATKLAISQAGRRDWTLGMAASSGELLLRDESAGITLSQYNTAGYVSLGGASAAEALRATYTASAVNYANVYGGTAGNRVSMFAEGSDTNIALALGSKGTGNVDILGSGGAVQSRFTSTALAVNYLQFEAGTTGNRVSMIANGSNTNVNLALSSRGTGTIDLMTGSTARVGMRLVDTASSVNWFEVVPSATGSRVNIKANGSDTNVPIGLSSKGTGVIDLLTNNATVVGARIAHVASAVNYLQISPAVAASPVKLEAVGTDTNIDLLLTPKGTGLVRTAYASTAATTPAAFSAARALAVNAGGTTVYIPCATAVW